MQQTFCCWGPLFVCPATLIYCLDCVLVAVLCQCKTAACGLQTERWCRLGRRTEVSDEDTLLSFQQSVAIMQHKSCGCRAGNVINLDAASKWFQHVKCL